MRGHLTIAESDRLDIGEQDAVGGLPSGSRCGAVE